MRTYARTNADGATCWYVDFMVDGKRHRVKAGTSRTEAEAWLEQAKGKRSRDRLLGALYGDDPLFKPVDPVAFDAFALRYYARVSLPQKRSWRRDADVFQLTVPHFGGAFPGEDGRWPIPKRDEAFDAFRRRVEGYLATFRGTAPLLTAIRTETIQKYAADRAAAGKKPATVNRDLILLSNLWNVAISWGHARHNPVKAVKRDRTQSIRERVLTEDEEKKLFARLHGPARRIALLALHTGLRFGEILSLAPADVDLEGCELRVIPTNSKSKRVRHIPLNDVALGVLSEALAGGVGRGRVFTYGDGSAVKSIRTVFENAVKGSAIGPMRFHDLRHTFASRLTSAGVDLNTVRELLGHRDFSTTLRYAHLAPSARWGAVKLLSAPPAKDPGTSSSAGSATGPA